MEERIAELETRLAYQDKLVADLDEVVRAFTIRVEELERALKVLRQSLEQQSIGPQDDPPPHY